VTRVLGVFDTRDALLAALDAAKQQQLTVVTALTPAHDEMVIEAVGVPSTWAGRIAAGGGILGALLGLLFPAWTVEQWPRLIVGGKPLLSWPTFLVISFESALLCAALAVVVAYLFGTWHGRRMAGSPAEALRAARPLVTDASSGLLIACPSERAADAAALFERCGAVIWRLL
jgi:hypothetical protein